MHAVRSIKTACFGERYRGYFNMRGDGDGKEDCTVNGLEILLLIRFIAPFK